MKLLLSNSFYISDITAADKAAYIEHFKEKQIYEQTGAIPYPYTEKDAEWWINHIAEQTKAQGRSVNWCIRRADGYLVGGIGFLNLTVGKSHKAELGYWLAKPYWNQGIISEAVKLVTNYAFEELGLIKISAHLFAYNIGSARALEKAGFQLEGELQNHYKKDGKIFDGKLYGKVNPKLEAKTAEKNQERVSASAIKTDIYHAQNDLFSFLKKNLAHQKLEGKVLAITSKLISLAEGQVVSKDSTSKKTLVEKEADAYLGEGEHGVELTLKHGLLIPSAGIDESNSEFDQYILFPKNPYQSAQEIWNFLKKEFQLRQFGVIVTDSRSMPLRLGVTGVALSHWGFKATRSLVGEKDIFQKPLKFTQVNIADSLATMAVLVMGESNDCCPLAIVSGAKLEFSENSRREEIQVEPQNDLYYPLLKPLLRKN